MALAKCRVPNFLVDYRSKENKDASHEAVFPSQERRADASSPKLVDFFTPVRISTESIAQTFSIWSAYRTF